MMPERFETMIGAPTLVLDDLCQQRVLLCLFELRGFGTSSTKGASRSWEQ